MKYNQFELEKVERIWKLFSEHSSCMNGSSHISDRDRFAKKIEYLLKDKCFILMDKVSSFQKIGITNGYFEVDKIHKYSPKGEEVNECEYFWHYEKAFLKIKQVAAVNQMNGNGYISLICNDERENTVTICLTKQNLKNLQWKEISDNEFKLMVDIFKDNREPVKFKYTTLMSFEEMVEKKLCRKNCAVNEIPTIYKDDVIFGRDYDEAYASLKAKDIYPHTLCKL